VAVEGAKTYFPLFFFFFLIPRSFIFGVFSLVAFSVIGLIIGAFANGREGRFSSNSSFSLEINWFLKDL
jgi:hypothetical protein